VKDIDASVLAAVRVLLVASAVRNCQATASAWSADMCARCQQPIAASDACLSAHRGNGSLTIGIMYLAVGQVTTDRRELFMVNALVEGKRYPFKSD
jgi:hypothetical protein